MKRFSLIALALTLAVGFSSSAQADRPLVKTKFDPDAQQVDLFEAMEEEQIGVRAIPKDEFGGNLLIENKGEAPLTVKVPPGFVAIPVSAQFDDFGGGGGAGGQGGGGGQQQAAGGGLGGGGGGLGGGQGGGGGGFFSIPPQKTLRVPYVSVCLEHGKPTPHPRTPYTIIPTEKFTDNPVLVTLVDMVGTGRLETASAQAAAWAVSSEMSWQELAAKKYDRVGRPDTPYFSHSQLMAAQNIVASAQAIAKDDSQPAATPATRQGRTVR